VRTLLLLIILASPAAALADDEPEAAAVAPEGKSPIDGVQGHLGIGYFTGFAPVGIRYWMDRQVGIDLGLDGALSSGGLDSYRIAVELGGLYSLAHYHYSVVFSRIGLGYRWDDNFGEHAGTERQDIVLNLFVGAELFLGALGFPNVSLQGGYGVQASWALRGGSKFLLGTASAGLDITGTGLLGFHIYL
jgi:hypothetical protein